MPEPGYYVKPPKSDCLNVALVAGPMYDGLYDLLPEFERASGFKVHVAARLVHPELNAHLDEVYRAGRGQYDLVSTHSKYAPSQKFFLKPLDPWLQSRELEDFIPSVLEMSRVDGWLLTLPRNIDVRLLYYRRDWFDDPAERERFRATSGRELRVPETWEELAQLARHFTRPPDRYGFAFPGRDSGLFGSFFELVAMGGGQLFLPDLRPGFENAAGRWALGYLRRLYLEDRVTPRDLPEMRYDEVSALFRKGQCAMIADWPGGFYQYGDETLSAVAGRFDVAIYPVGPSGARWIYAGGHAFGIPTSVRHEAGALALVKFLTSPDAQWHEAKTGAISVLKSVSQRVLDETPAESLAGRRLELLRRTVRSHMLLPPRFAKYPPIEEALWTWLQKGITGATSVEESLAGAARMMEQILSG